ncbi:hypothetical protein KGF54_003385 [Candida jiufengensis]|uniref:uncharacterized protein n=1 Tax=Candida jiufengensis TaxID=497108 RepID=UPI0022252E5E|nr:uncharacterized protein KGF54_003385 [Candida jiufengensis]KAI5952518.1 hypothetical protein KGF54_003385 [Candida jiufengensis]
MTTDHYVCDINASRPHIKQTFKTKTEIMNYLQINAYDKTYSLVNLDGYQVIYNCNSPHCLNQLVFNYDEVQKCFKLSRNYQAHVAVSEESAVVSSYYNLDKEETIQDRKHNKLAIKSVASLNNSNTNTHQDYTQVTMNSGISINLETGENLQLNISLGDNEISLKRHRSFSEPMRESKRFASRKIRNS